MSPLRQHDRLREIREEIEKLEAKLIEDERTANGLVGLPDGNAVGHAEAEVLTTRWRLDALLREHMTIATALLETKCPIHPPDALYVSCEDCCRAWRHVSRAS